MPVEFSVFWWDAQRVPVKVKICGITSVEDARAAVESGADMLGFVFCSRSPRNVSRQQATAIIGIVPAHVARVGVFVNEPMDELRRTYEDCGLTIVQLHGDEDPEFVRELALPSWKAFRVRDAEVLELLPQFTTDAWLLDAWSPSAPGGTGERFDWELASRAKGFQRPIVLAGGLTPSNVGTAVAQVQPFAVDVSSGVELAPGRKDPTKVREFIAAAKRV